MNAACYGFNRAENIRNRFLFSPSSDEIYGHKGCLGVQSGVWVGLFFPTFLSRYFL